MPEILHHIFAVFIGAFFALMAREVTLWAIWRLQAFWYKRKRRLAGGAWVFPHGNVRYDPSKLSYFTSADFFNRSNKSEDFPSEIDVEEKR